VICEVNFARGYGYEDLQHALGTDKDLRFLDFDTKIKHLPQELTNSERYGEDWLVSFQHP
jgi:hypothetical protein